MIWEGASGELWTCAGSQVPCSTFLARRKKQRTPTSDGLQPTRKEKGFKEVKRKGRKVKSKE